MKTTQEVTVASCIWCFSHSHYLCVAVGVMNCHLLCESPALLNCTTQVHSSPVNGYSSYQVPQFILLYSSGCGSVQFKCFWPCDTQDLNLRHCQSRELARNICVRQKEKSRHVWGAGDTEQHCSGALHFPGVGELLCLWQLHPQLPTSAAPEGDVCHPVRVQDVPSHSLLPFIQFGQISDGLLGMSQQELEAPRALWLSPRMLAGKQWGHSTSGCYLRWICCHCRRGN